MTRAPLLLLLLAGCGPTNNPMPTPEDMAMRAQSDLAPDAIMDLEGRIIGLDRAGLSGVTVSLCRDTCRDTMTDTRGGFAFPATPVDFYTLRARRAGGDYADLDFPLYLVRGSNPRLLPLVLPKVGTNQSIAPGAQTIPIDAALSLTLDGSALALPKGGAVTKLGGVRIPADLFPNFCVPSARVLAIWAFAPTYITSTSLIGAQLGDPLGLAPGTTVQFIDISPQDGRPEVVASGAVSQDGKSITTSMKEGMHRLGWLLVAVISGGP